ncbi:hypothetical protein TRIUR3_33202 [Triticum urartu]|uniref:Uncharacterized protein n=1 Tax=Triticum urartu TaxID=4572 RepID=M7ZA65_TRIUA|nr:hypothetical protein TRIUR3_33202 [Triticum urartu]
MAERKGCHSNISVLITQLRYRCKREVCGCVEHARDGGRLAVVVRSATGGAEDVNGWALAHTHVEGKVSRWRPWLHAPEKQRGPMRETRRPQGGDEEVAGAGVWRDGSVAA